METKTLVACFALAGLPFSGGADEAFVEDFEKFSIGEEPDLFVLNGSFTVEMDGENKVLQLGPEPLDEGMVQLGKSFKTGAEITVRAKGSQKRRSFPRFGVGLHGMSGYRMRVVPAKRVLELVKNDDVVLTAPFAWSPGQWHRLRLRVRRAGDESWKVEGWAWIESEKAPEKPSIVYNGEDQRLQGKGSVVGTPYSGFPILFDQVEIRAAE